MARRGRPPREKRELSVPGLRSLGLPAAFFPPPTVDRILEEMDRVEQRTRLLPSRLVVYYVLPMALHAREGYRELYRLVTTILDPDRTPTRELAALYSERWEVEISMEELKIYRGRPNAWCSAAGSPTGYFRRSTGSLPFTTRFGGACIMLLLNKGLDPDRLSFTSTLRAMRRGPLSALQDKRI